MSAKINNFTTIDSVYGKFVVNRHCAYQAEHLIKTGHPHIQEELDKILFVIKTLPQGCTIIDAGANIGLVAVPMAREIRARGGTVIAFEVQRMMYYALCGSAALNDLENIQAYNMALGSTTGMMKAYRLDYSKPQDFGLFSLADQNNPNALDQIPVVTIDSLDLSGLDFFKIDVEGMEIDVLRGAHDTIKKYRPWCWVEYWKTGIDDIKQQFAGLDYKFFLMDKLNMLCAPATRLAAAEIEITIPEV